MPTTAAVIDLSSKKILCDRCGVKQSCLGNDLGASQLSLDRKTKGPPRLFQRGDHVFRVGDPFYSLHVIRSGAIKTYVISEDGEEQIIGFYGPGETIGFDAIADGKYQCNAAALDTSSVCGVTFEAVAKLCQRSPALLHALMKSVSGETTRLAEMLLLGKKTADQRMASFLLDQSKDQRRRGYSATALTLSMTRTDIGKYLGLTVETVSRVLTRLEAQGLVTKNRRQIRIHDLKALRHIAAESVDRLPVESVSREVLA